MQIWVDADACPNTIKEIIFRAAERTKILTTFVSNQFIRTPHSLYIKTKRVASGFDVADNEIIQSLAPTDLVITADIPLANAVVEKGGVALNPRGEIYTKNNIRQCVSLRDFSAGLRDSGVSVGGPPKLNKKDLHAFAKSLDKLLKL